MLISAVVLVPGRVAALEDGRLIDLLILPKEGERFQHVEFSCWIPGGVTPLRGLLIHQHGCTNATPETHPPVTLDYHWRALARKHRLAILSPQYHVAGACDEWNNPASGSERALFTALAQIAAESGHAELSEVPWVLWGHSGGSSWSAQMILRHPGRVLAASFRGGCHKQFGDAAFREGFGPAARELPLLFVWGKRESVPTSKHHVSWEPMNTMFSELRLRGGTVTRVIDPLSEHGCDNSRLLVIPFFDAVLTALEKGVALPGALRDKESFEPREIDTTTRIDPSLTWLPNTEMGEWWREFSEKGNLVSGNGPLNRPEFFATRGAGGKVSLDWRIVPDLAGGVRSVLLYRDGQLWKELGPAPGKPLATSRDAPPEGLRAQPFIDEQGNASTYGLRFRDAAGNKSPAVEVEAR